jgi:hypothetical protein
MLEVQGNMLVFTFPEVHPEAKLEIVFHRTLRIPDDDKTYPLPPSLGHFPIKHVDDFKANVGDDMVKRGGVMVPMYQSEALWVGFIAANVTNRGQYPFVVKIAAGKRSAVTGKEWTDSLKEDDYCVVPGQPWIDGFVIAEGTIRQFVAAPLGMGFTVEEQLTQKAEFGGMQIEVYPMKREEFNKRFPVRPPQYFGRGVRSEASSSVFPGVYSWNGPLVTQDAAAGGEESLGVTAATMGVLRGRPMAMANSVKSMGMAAGGRMTQKIFKDPYGLEVWDLNHKSRTFVHLLNSMTWRQVTGQEAPHVPPTAAEYKRYNLPWFDYYRDTPAVGSTEETKKIKSVAELSEEKGFSVYPDNKPVDIDPKKVVAIKAPNPNAVKDGAW